MFFKYLDNFLLNVKEVFSVSVPNRGMFYYLFSVYLIMAASYFIFNPYTWVPLIFLSLVSPLALYWMFHILSILLDIPDLLNRKEDDILINVRNNTIKSLYKTYYTPKNKYYFFNVLLVINFLLLLSYGVYIDEGLHDSFLTIAMYQSIISAMMFGIYYILKNYVIYVYNITQKNNDNKTKRNIFS